jgi:hypothetical protein
MPTLSTQAIIAEMRAYAAYAPKFYWNELIAKWADALEAAHRETKSKI